jgi:hypothetical protein
MLLHRNLPGLVTVVETLTIFEKQGLIDEVFFQSLATFISTQLPTLPLIASNLDLLTNLTQIFTE